MGNKNIKNKIIFIMILFITSCTSSNKFIDDNLYSFNNKNLDVLIHSRKKIVLKNFKGKDNDYGRAFLYSKINIGYSSYWSIIKMKKSYEYHLRKDTLYFFNRDESEGGLDTLKFKFSNGRIIIHPQDSLVTNFNFYPIKGERKTFILMSN